MMTLSFASREGPRRFGFKVEILLASFAAWSLLGLVGVRTLAAELTPTVNPVELAGDHTSPAGSHLAKAQKALKAGDLRQAKTHLQLALRADPKSAEAHLMLGIVEFQSGDTAGAIQHYQRALRLEPDSFACRYNLALAYLREGKLQDGLRQLERAVVLDPRHAGAAYNLGLVLLDLGRPEEALKHLSLLRTLGPIRPDVAFNIIRADLATHRIDEARHEAEQAAEALGADPEWGAAIGRLFLDQGQPRVAAAYLAEALHLRPDREETRRQLAGAYLQSERAADALELIQNPTTPEDHYLRASAYYLLRRLPEADQELSRALEQGPREPRSLLLGARIRQQLGHHVSALELLREASELAPRWAEPHYSAGVSYYFLRRYSDARRSLNQSLQLDPRSVRSFFLYGVTLLNEGKNREGEEYLRRAIALEPENARFQLHLGSLLLRDNRPSEAQEAFEKAVQLKPDYALPHYQLGKLLARLNHPEAAVGELEKAVQYQPDLAQAYYQLARVYTMLGDTEKSTRSLATFNQLKKQEVDDEREFTEDVNKELELP